MLRLLGYVVIMLCIVIYWVVTALSDQDVIAAISAYSPWIALHSGILAYISGLVLSIAVAFIPFRAKVRDVHVKQSSIISIGIYTLVALSVLSIAYIASILLMTVDFI
ncbi:MAG: hypothetical protein HRT95_05690 [Moritella sp.]|uniref:hypothetical protein n=1 Tax=Moritella sp. TaxID=78556 RepID=UPI001D3D1117|nr:hypothetical protein [Moritella sp.]NQZ49683.1 hypothetical protein [Moritella sp.]